MAAYGGGFKDLQRVVAHQGIPFDIRSARPEPSMAELQEVKRQSQERDYRIAKSVCVGRADVAGACGATARCKGPLAEDKPRVTDRARRG